MKKIKAWIAGVKAWYNSLTASIEEGIIKYSLSDTQFFWITTVWLILFPFVTYAVFWLGVANWAEYLVFVSLEIFVLVFKFAKYINVEGKGFKFQAEKESENND